LKKELTKERSGFITMQAELNKVRAEKDTMSKELYGYKA
jgi:hypothetical protein